MNLFRGVGIAVLAVALVAADGATEPTPEHGPAFVHLHSPRLACLGTTTQVTGCIRLSEGYFMDEPTYNRLDAEVQRLQDAETRMKAENEYLKKAQATWQPGWKTLTTALVTGIALGAYVHAKI